MTATIAGLPTLDDIRAVVREELAAAGAMREGMRAAVADHDSDRLLTAKQAAELAGCSHKAWKQRRRRDPRIDALSVGEDRLRRWPRSTLLAYLRDAKGGEK